MPSSTTAGISERATSILARETLAADLRWRDPASYALRERRAAACSMQRLQHTQGWEQEQCLVDFIFLHRKSPALRSLFETFEWQERRAVFIDAAREEDIPALVAMVAQHEGQQSARLAIHWLERQRQRALVFREGAAGSQAPPAGFVQWIALHEVSIADLAADPATRGAWDYVLRHAPLRPGESAIYRRFEMSRESYQSASSVQSLNVIDWERHLLTTPGLGPVFKAYADAEYWTPLLEYAEVPRMASLDFEVGGRRYAVFGLDLRALPPLTRLARLTDGCNQTGGSIMATYLLVHGGWVGGWFWGRVASLLRAAGHQVFTPTLTGVGERAHLASPAIDFETHLQDILGVLHYEDLSEVILVGHSSGGVVVTAVAEQAATRLAHAVYLDAFVPQDGQSLADLLGPQMVAGLEQLAQAHGAGWQLPFPFTMAHMGISSDSDWRWMESRLTPYPFRTIFHPLRLGNPAAAALPRTFIYCNAPAMGLFDQAATFARASAWRYRELAAGHAAPVTAPGEVARLLLEVAQDIDAAPRQAGARVGLLAGATAAHDQVQ